VEISVKLTVSGDIPVVGVPEKSATGAATAAITEPKASEINEIRKILKRDPNTLLC
jgi:hypothetical protein